MGNLLLGGSWLEPMYSGWVSFLWINRACVSPGIEAWHLLPALNLLMTIQAGSFYEREVQCSTWAVSLYFPAYWWLIYIFRCISSADLSSCLLIWVRSVHFRIKKYELKNYATHSCFGPVISMYGEFKFTNVGTAVVSLSVSVKSLSPSRVLFLRQNL